MRARCLAALLALAAVAGTRSEVTAAAARAATAAVPPAAAADAAGLVRAYNARDFGSPGWRRVYLELKSGATVTRTFTVLHFWRPIGDQLRSLVVLEQPAGLRGTSYLLDEDPKVPTGMTLYMRLPVGLRQVLTITPGRFEEGLLGSDFSYTDLRWRLAAGRRLTLAGKTLLRGREVWMVDAVPATPAVAESTAWSRVRYYLSADRQLILGADFFRQAAGAPEKQLRIDAFRQVGTSWTPLRMTMLLAGGRSSVLTLRDIGALPAAIGPQLFEPAMLPTVADRWTAWVASGLLVRSGP